MIYSDRGYKDTKTLSTYYKHYIEILQRVKTFSANILVYFHLYLV